MPERDSFWTLAAPFVIKTEDALYQKLQTSGHLMDCLYEPEKLDRNVNYSRKITNKIFERVSLSKTEISNLIFSNCKFIDCQFIGTNIKNCEFHNCDFVNSNTYKIHFIETYIDPKSFKRCLNRKRHQNIGVHLYQNLLNNSRDSEQIEFERYAQFMFLRWKRFQEGYEIQKSWNGRDCLTDVKAMEVSKRLGYLRRYIWEWLFGSGVRIRHFVATVFAVMIISTALNYYFRTEFGLANSGAPISDLTESFYFTSVSLTTLGYGDIVPTTKVGRIFAAIQGVMGFFMFALLASMLFRRVAP